MTVAPAAPTASPDSREKILQLLEKQVHDEEAKARQGEAAAKKRGETAKSQQKDLTELRRASGEVDQSIAAYKVEYPKLTQRHDDLNGYRTSKRTRIEAAVGADKATIQAAIDWLTARLGTLETKLEADRTALEGKRADVKAAEDALAATRQEYDEAKGRSKAVGDGLKGLEDLRKEIDKLEDELDGADTDEERKQAARKAYVTLGELDRQSDQVVKPKLVDEKTHADERDAAWRQWNTAQTNLRGARDQLQTAQETHDGTKRELEELKEDRIGAVMKRL
jgi:chromosome segregation ATPase